jgi:hypothetical protein
MLLRRRKGKLNIVCKNKLHCDSFHYTLSTYFTHGRALNLQTRQLHYRRRQFLYSNLVQLSIGAVHLCVFKKQLLE